MTQSVMPTQRRYNDPYQQKILQFDTTDPQLYLSRVSNFMLKSIGNDAVVSGLDIKTTEFVDNELFITINPGLLIQDSTLIEITEEFQLSIDISNFDPCTGKLIIYTSYVYLESLEANKLLVKLSYITNDGLIILPGYQVWDYNRNRLYLNILNFSKHPDNDVVDVPYPNFFYISGKKYDRRGHLNFSPTDIENTGTTPEDINVVHDLNTYNLFTQLYDETLTQCYINDLTLPDVNSLDINIEEYKTFENNFQMLIADPNDITVYTILKEDLSNNVWLLEHNLDQYLVQVQVYNDRNEIVHPRYINLIDNNSLEVDFINLTEDLAASYKILINQNITIIQLEESDFITDILEVQHNLNKKQLIVQIVNNITGNILLETQSIQLIDINTLYINTLTCDTILPGEYSILLYRNTRDIFNLYTDNTYSKYYNMYTKLINILNTPIVLNHNLDSKYNIVQFLDSDDNIVQPDEVQVIDENLTNVIFNEVQDVSLTAIVYNNDTTFDLEYPYTLDLSTSFYDYPVFQFYDENDYQIVPNEVINNSNVYTFDFDDQLDTTVHVVMGYGFNYYSELVTVTNTTIVSILHNLNTLYPIVQVYQDGALIGADNINIIDYNNIDVTLHSGSYKVVVLSGLERSSNTRGNLGKPITWRGVWNSSTTYNQYDVVQYNGSSYVASFENFDDIPVLSDYWDLWVEKGEIGLTGEKGDTGEKGETGDKGDTGEKGDTGLKGDIGLKGDTGDTGEKGDKGDKGDDGSMPSLSRVNKTQTDSPVTLVADDCSGFKTFTNTGSSSTVSMLLPAGADGYRLYAIVTSAYSFSFVANGIETIRYLDTVSIAGGSINSSTIGHTIQLDWSGTEWIASIMGLFWNLETS